MTGMGQNKIKLSVIGHQKKPLRMIIQSSHGKYTFPHTAEIIHDRSSSRRIRNGSNHTIRLIEQIVAERFWLHNFTEGFNFILTDIRFCSQLSDYLSVYTDTACQNQFFRFTAGADPCMAQYFL